MNFDFAENINYLLIDAARADKNMGEVFTYDLRIKSLYEGRRAVAFKNVCPYLSDMVYNSDFSDWYFKTGWGDSWGVFVISELDFDALIDHFRQFIKVEDMFGKSYFFRFYDPRVLRKFLPTCDEQQLERLFNGVEHYIVEDENPEKAIDFSLKNGKLQKRVIDLTEAGNNSGSNKRPDDQDDVFDDDFDTIV